MLILCAVDLLIVVYVVTNQGLVGCFKKMASFCCRRINGAWGCHSDCARAPLITLPLGQSVGLLLCSDLVLQYHRRACYDAVCTICMVHDGWFARSWLARLMPRVAQLRACQMGSLCFMSAMKPRGFLSPMEQCVTLLLFLEVFLNFSCFATENN